MDIESLRPLIDPKSIAIIGASADLTKIGGRPIKYLIEFDYQGRILPINPKYDEIAGRPCYPDINSVPGDIDLALVIVPSSKVIQTVQECGERGVRSLVIISAGFAEVSEEGRQAQEEISRLAKKYTMRVLGPNTVGMFNLLSGVMANFGAGKILGDVPKGRIGIVSQSGAFCGYIYTLAAQNRIGLNYFIGTGNEADVEVADCIAYMAEDPNTDVIGCYIEGCKDGNKLLEALELARKRRKPVIVLKIGQSEAGRKAALSHTASLVGADDVFDAICKQSGVYRVESMQEFMDVAMACSYGVIPQGKRVAIFSISGGGGAMLADHLSVRGLSLPEPGGEVKEELLKLVPYASVNNPIDMTGQLVNQPEMMRDFVKTVLGKVSYDIAVTFIATQGYFKPMLKQVLGAIQEVREAYPHIPHLLTTVFTPETRTMMDEAGIAVYDDLLRAAKVTKALCEIGEGWNASDGGPAAWEKKPLNLPESSVQALTEADSKRILGDYGIPVTLEKVAKTPEEAVRFAEEIGYPVVLKGMSPQILHKTDAGLVHLNVQDKEEVVSLFQQIKSNIGGVSGAEFEGVLIQEMLQPAAAELIVGSKRDPVFGPMVMVGLGGIFVEVFNDIAIRKAPVSVDAARQMIEELRGAALLKGLRGKPQADMQALSEIVAALSRLAADYADEIEEVDINPVMVYPQGLGAKAADALIKFKAQVAVEI